MTAGNQWKHQEFSLSSLPLSKSSFSLLNLNTFRARNMLPMSRIVKKPCSIFKTKNTNICHSKTLLEEKNVINECCEGSPYKY